MLHWISASSLQYAQYDELLSQGWFRSTDQMYQADLICIGEGLYSAQHIRLNVSKWVAKKSHRKIIKKLMGYRVVFREAHFTQRHQELYELQSKRFQSFVLRDPSGLFHNPGCVGFRTMEVAIYSGDQLIAFSLFDVGFKAMASLLCCYDPGFAHLSLGVATMLFEIQYAGEHGISLYYPGYVLDEPTRMDYKLSLGNFEFLQNHDQWKECILKPASNSNAHQIKLIIQSISELLSSFEIKHKIWLYPLYTLALKRTTTDGDWSAWPLNIELSGYSGIFISVDPYSGGVVVYSGSILNHLTIPHSVWPSSEFLDQEKFILNPLRVDKIWTINLIQGGDNRLSIIAKLLQIILYHETGQTNSDTHSPS
jgi:arginyl-tRNA--protein-N-Asp/Glu arginylyltransferase